jgi:AraC family transcriptional activator of tynA and feaB
MSLSHAGTYCDATEVAVTSADVPVVDLDLVDGMITSHLPWVLTADDYHSEVVGSVQSQVFGELRLVNATAGASEFRRGRRELALSADEYVVVMIVIDGREIIEQDGRQTIVPAGSTVVWDSVRTAAAHIPDHVTKQSLFVPRERFCSLVPRPEMVTMQALPPSPATLLLKSLLGGVEEAAAMDTTTESAASTASLELVRAICMQAMPSAKSWDDSALLVSTRNYVDSHLGDPALDPARIARAHGVSRRRLYELFATTEEPVWAYIRRRRLGQAYDELTRFPPQRSIATIGRSVGYTSAAHFTRAFRAHFNLTPSDLRRRVSS